MPNPGRGQLLQAAVLFGEIKKSSFFVNRARWFCQKASLSYAEIFPFE